MGTVRPAVRPDAKMTKPKIATKPKSKAHKKRRLAHKPKTASSRVTTTKPVPPLKDHRAIGDPVMMPKRDTTKK
jgi:hypothetical protein